MDGVAFQAARGFRLDPPGDRNGVSCGENGPSIGPVRLLKRAQVGFVPRPVAELDAIFGSAFGHQIDCRELLPGLQSVARALNVGDLTRAMIATQFMRLPRLSDAEADRAAAAEELLKAAADDPKHPGGPRGTPGGVGGRYRPKIAEVSEEAVKLARQRLRRLILRRAFRQGLQKFLTLKRIGRFSVEAASNVVPGLDVVGDLAGVADIGEAMTEFGALRADAEVALEFAAKGPRSLDELRVSTEDETFPSYDAFKKAEPSDQEELTKRFGPAPPGYEYHHIVEQGRNALAPEAIQSTRNIVRIPKLLHEEINSEYSELEPEVLGRFTRRQVRRTKDYASQYHEGIEVMRKVGILQ